MNNPSYAAFSEQALAIHRPVLFRYALLQLHDAALAEDAVQDALLAALQNPAAFEGKAGMCTWLIGILKHKIADHWRRSAREAPLPEYNRTEGDESEDSEDDYFLADGHWNSRPAAWADPEAALKREEFWTIYEVCQNNLPPKMAQVFMLRELVGLEAEEICTENGLTLANYWVLMYRARLRLRECLEIRWFNKT